MRRSLLRATSALAVAVPLALAAPTAMPAQSSTLLTIPEPGFACPVDLSVRRNNPFALSQVDRSTDHRNSQRIHLTLTPLNEPAGPGDPDRPAIRSIAITVHATSPAPRITPAGSSTPTTIDRSFTLIARDRTGLHDRDLWIDNVASVVSVDLTSITYADGTTWHRSAASVCRAIPNGVLLIGTR